MIIKRLIPSDADLLYELVESSRSGLMNLEWAASATYASTFAFLKEKWSIDSKDKVHGIFVDADLVGSIELRACANGDDEIGYWMGSAYRNKGIMTEAVTLLMAAHKQQQPNKKVTAKVRIENVYSRKVLKRAGFHEVEVTDDWVFFQLG